MAYYTQTRTNSAIERALSFMADAFSEAALRYAQHKIYRNTLSELRALSNRELADLGMSRSMLRSVAWQAAQDSTAR